MKLKNKGFTLIELLVVIAIIGVLASVVLSSLNSARKKGQIAAIKSNLKNMIPQAELAYSNAGNYSTVCNDTKIVAMMTTITGAGGTASCYSFNSMNEWEEEGDLNLRWGASARLNSDSTKNFSVTSAGVVTWDTADISVGYLDWAQANTACSSAGGRLPTPEELTSLYDATGGTPSGFQSDDYWSGTTYPLNTVGAYYVGMGGGSVGSDNKSFPIGLVRCVH